MSGEGEHTKADLDAIKEMGTGLNNVRKAFEGLDKLKGKYREDFGHGDLESKFEDFAENWELSREKLTEEIKALAKIATAAAKAYEDIDHQLAEAIRGAQKGNSRKGGN
ncbi:hypothetical protein [Streptomyces sp. NPDC056405]|uniref:hypothetical protein n=1 Tax=Streptomyces sp. NPDC056405 TaxID=3345811 RepID=UPI0035DEAAFE